MSNFNFKFKTFVITLMGVFFLSVSEAYASKQAELIVNGSVVTTYDSDNGKYLNNAWTDALKYSGATKATVKAYGNNRALGTLAEINSTNKTGTVTELTIDLNGCRIGHVTSTIDWFLRLNLSGFKLIVKDSKGSGDIETEWTKDAGYLMCMRVDAGELVLQSGKIMCTNKNTAAIDARAVHVGGGKFTMTGGTVESKKPNGTLAYGVLLGDGSVDIQGGTIKASATDNVRVLQVNGGTMTISGGTITAETSGSTIYEINASAGSCTVTGGKFNCPRGSIVNAYNSGTISLEGGYYNETSGTTFKNQIAAKMPNGGASSTSHEVLTLISDDTEYGEGYSYVITPKNSVAKLRKTGIDTRYYTTLKSAIDDARPLGGSYSIIMLQGSNEANQITFNPGTATTCTLDLNNKTIAYTGANSYFINTGGVSGNKLIITDNSGSEGTIKYEGAISGVIRTIIAGSSCEVNLLKGKVLAKNTADNASYACAVNVASGGTFTMEGGEVEAYK